MALHGDDVTGEDAFCHRYKLAPAITDSLSAFVKTKQRATVLPGASVVKHSPADAGDTGLIPDPEDPTQSN